MNCPICLELFTEDEAHIPDLSCGCNLIVHEECWQPWSGECLYCRNTEIIEYIPNPIPVEVQVIPREIPRENLYRYTFFERFCVAVMVIFVSFIIQTIILYGRKT